MSERVYIKSARTHNYGGLPEFAAKFEKFALICGRNAAGKSTVLKAIATVFEGGCDPAMIRVGASEAIVEIEFSNGYAAKKTMRKNGFELVVTSPDGGAIRSPKAFLDTLAPSLSYSPLGFLDAPAKDRAAFLLKTLPLLFTGESVNDAVKQPGLVPPTSTISLQQLNEIREGKYSARTTINVSKKELEGTINLMRKSLPPNDATDWVARRDELNSGIVNLKAEIRSEAANIHSQANEFIAGRKLEAQKKKAAHTADFEAGKARILKELEELTALYRENISTIDLVLEREVSEASRITAEELAEKTAELEARVAKLQGEHGEAKAQADEQLRTQGVLQVIESRTRALDGYIAQEIALTRAIEDLDRLKHTKLKELPIEGFDLVMDGKTPVITINGIPLDQLNRQQQIYTAIQFVQQAAGSLPMILCECAELDDEHMSELAEACKEADIQLIVARWENDAPLQVKTAA